MDTATVNPPISLWNPILSPSFHYLDNKIKLKKKKKQLMLAGFLASCIHIYTADTGIFISTPAQLFVIGNI